ncbi:MAG TPA: OmpA family protein, partial [Nannocystaceae bacterium]|nr:OmpA family protein [Nannocystaceae bacterium]
AYLAHRRALLAMASADERVAHEDAAEARQAFETMRVAELDDARGEVQTSRSKLEADRAARDEAEVDARRAIDRLAPIARVDDDAQRIVITMSDDELFTASDATLSAVARARLDRVAEALAAQGDDKAFVVTGYTDARGSDEADQRLSQRRAEAVRSYLVSRGVRSDAIEAIGKGERDPVADGESVGAGNRRIEIVVEPADAGRPPPSQ